MNRLHATTRSNGRGPAHQPAVWPAKVPSVEDVVHLVEREAVVSDRLRGIEITVQREPRGLSREREGEVLTPPPQPPLLSS